MNTNNTISTLNNLIESCKDGQDGFHQASENVDSSDLKSLFSKYSLQRSKFAGELQQLVIGLGGEEEKSSSVTGALHRGWIDLKAALTSRDDHAILAECERGEDHAEASYKDALAEELPENVRTTVASQSVAVQAAHDDIRDRRDALAK